MTPLLEARALTKSYGQLRANDDVSFSISPGGGHRRYRWRERRRQIDPRQNAGRGDRFPIPGDIYVAGERIVMHSPADAKQAGISLVHQHFKLIES